MLESVYLSLIGISFLCLISSLCIGTKESRKLLSKAFLSSIAMILFGALSAASAGIEIVYCSTTSCATKSLFYGDNGYIMWAFALLSAAITLVHAIMLTIYLVKGEAANKTEEGSQI